MNHIEADVLVIGAGGGGLRAAIAIAESAPDLSVALISKVYPMRSHTVAAEGGAAGVVQDHDSFEYHFNDTVSGADWLADQDVVEFFVEQCPKEMLRLEHWGCPWSRREDGRINVRAFGGMKIERTWFAADKTGFHILHTLFQTSIKYPSIKRFDEYFCTDLLVDEGRVQGVLAVDIANGTFTRFLGRSVVMATGGAGRVYRFNTNGGIVTGDGMALAYRAGAPLRDMEFVQYHPTGLPGTGILMTEGCRGEGGILTNRDGYRYLQDYELGPETPIGQPRNKTMELGPRDRLSQAFWHEEQKGRVIETSRGTAVNLDLRHLGAQKINERLPFIRELASAYLGIDPVKEPIPVRPTVHYTMGGIGTDIRAQTQLPGLYAVGECASSGLHGANRLGSNSLAELCVMGRVAGEQAARHARDSGAVDKARITALSEAKAERWMALRTQKGSENPAHIRRDLADTMEAGVGIYRSQEGVQKTCDAIAELKQRYEKIGLNDGSSVFNTEWLYAIELGFLLDIGEVMSHSALMRKESRGSHQRLDEFNTRDDVNYLKHSLAYRQQDTGPLIKYQDVVITKSAPAARLYGEAAERKESAQEGKDGQ
ncbi:fumarate reductase (quinol) flavoprotein subunit [Aestuariirhabdus litorea]|uniref:Fumarate reductase flavoprotein subunit n=1 Tax=Aestuariirhabdus litorea TaxID=2528527 RepID=A0A3P3VK20_9GAMM|nr:fumarate reductase (quinol) flavoprotein subunit [Aestuariirhabdus litorea]RRJ83075.1 fumarate reductase (quinol) flavoprotein subunit [Aestuariirhabdus litorea]RWW93233.1 fumarate reductase (quinol) flavoprotein subunit [Endozoicomonadaceae bacterium GTF-13]